MKRFGEFVAFLSSEFQRYLIEHEEESVRVPSNAMIVFDVAGETDFNNWHREVSMRNREPGQPVFHVHVGSMRRHAAIEQVELDAVPV
jgi:hypothetical protein